MLNNSCKKLPQNLRTSARQGAELAMADVEGAPAAYAHPTAALFTVIFKVTHAWTGDSSYLSGSFLLYCIGICVLQGGPCVHNPVLIKVGGSRLMNPSLKGSFTCHPPVCCAGRFVCGVHTIRAFRSGVHIYVCHLYSIAHARLLDGESGNSLVA